MRNKCRGAALFFTLLFLVSAMPALAAGAPPEIAGLLYESTLDLRFATCFDVHFYADGYALIDVYGSARYLVVPEGLAPPEGLDEDVVALFQPLDTIYLAATSAMALFDALDAVDAIRFSGTEASGWYIDSAVDALSDGRMLFAGKYSQPDYEMLIGEDCDLAIESTMILHTPKVQEMIELLGIPVFIDRSSYESHPLGRTEWIKLYAVLVGKGAEAERFFSEQELIIERLKGYPNTEKTVAFFYVSTDGAVNVRRAGDYVPNMIEIAGGRYAFPELGADLAAQRSTVSLTMEEFYATAVNSDFLIYNASIDQPLSSIDELINKSPLFADFKAVREGNVWCTGKYLYQATDIVGSLITDIHKMLVGEREGMTFLYQIH